MADRTPAAATAAPLPDEKTISRAEELVRERFLMPEEDPAQALAPGTPRRNALDAAVTELEAGAKVPSTEWRRRYSMLLGLERVLSDDEPKLADGTSLNPHQVDALSGTLTALLADQQRNAPPSSNGTAAVVAPEPVAPAPTNGAPAAEPVVGEDADLDLDSDVDPDADSDDSDETAAEAEAILEEDVAEDEEPLDYDAAAELELGEEDVGEAPEDPNAHKRFWFEHATGAGKTVAAMGFVDASRTGGILILTHRRNLVDQFNEELRTRGYRDRVRGPMLGDQDAANGPVTVETYQWFVRNAGNISSAYTVVICDEAHTALGEKTAAAIRNWTGPIFIGMTATGALIARHVTDLFPTQTSRFDLAQAARRGVIAPLRCVRIPPGVGVRTIAKVPLRRGEVDTEFDQELLAELLDQLPFNLAAADLYKTRFNGMPGVVYAAGVRHAYNLAEAFRAEGIKAEGVSGETPKRQLAEILAKYERGDIDVLINAQLLAEGWNSPRATVCFHLAPTASKRIYQQRVGRVTRRHPGKEAGIVVDFVAPGTKHDEPTITLHSLLDRDVYRGGAIVVGPVRRGRGRRVRVERRVLPVAADENRRIEVFERELWRIAVEHLDWGEQIQWAALAGARVSPTGWRRARAMLHFDRTGDLKRAFLLTAVQRNKNPQLRLRALAEIAASRDAEAFDTALDEVGGWPRDEKREACKLLLQSLAEKRIGRRDQADAWIWRVAGYTAELHEEYAVQRWPETKRLLGLLANSSGGGHARNARRLVHAGRKQDRRLAAAILAAATRYTHTPEAEEVLRGARTRLSRKPSSLSRELLRNFPKGRRGRSRRRKKKGAEGDAPQVEAAIAAAQDGTDLEDVLDDDLVLDETLDVDSDADSDAVDASEEEVQPTRSRRRRNRSRRRKAPVDEAAAAAAVAEAASALAGANGAEGGDDVPSEVVDAAAAVAETGEGSGGSRRSRGSRRRKQPPADVQAAIAAVSAAAGDGPVPDAEPESSNGAVPTAEAAAAVEAEAEAPAKPKRASRAKKADDEAPRPKRATRAKKAADDDAVADEAPKPKRASRAKKPAATADASPETDAVADEAPKPKRASRAKKADDDAPADEKPKRASRAKKPAAAASAEGDADEAPKPKRAPRASRAKKPAADDAAEPAESSAA